MNVREMRPEDLDATAQLLQGSVEAHLRSPGLEPVRAALGDQWVATERLHGWLGNPDRILFVAEDEAAGLRGLLVGKSVDGRGHIDWVAVPEHGRRGGAGAALVEEAMEEMRRRDCFLCDAFATEDRAVASLFRRAGMRRAAYLANTLLGSPSVYIMRDLREATDEERTQHIIVVGDAGQGIQLLGHVLARLLADLGKEVSLNVTKPSSVRGGTIAAELAFSEYPVRTPFFVNANLLVQLSPGAPPHSVRAKRIMVDESLQQSGLPEQVSSAPGSGSAAEVYQFTRQAREAFGSPLFVNMIALGRILGHFGWGFERLALPEELPKRFQAQNLDAVRMGHYYDLPHVYWTARDRRAARRARVAADV